jgi:hypothetical protein
MRLEPRPVGKACRTVGAVKRLDAAVQTFVSTQGTRQSKLLATVTTSVRFKPRMKHHVPSQPVDLAKSFMADFADVRLSGDFADVRLSGIARRFLSVGIVFGEISLELVIDRIKLHVIVLVVLITFSSAQRHCQLDGVPFSILKVCYVCDSVTSRENV